jgi:predicted RNA-binding Zn-ribbon protein involved in translation (DUF1610 family)
MQPDKSKITISNNIEQTKQLLLDLVLLPRLKALEWASITKQTPNMKIGYPGQHLASLVTGMPGTRTGARGHDLIDGSETKSCSRVDQLDKCNACSAKVMRIETECPECGSDNIKRNDDSKWLFTIRSEADLKLLTQTVPRVILALADYPYFEDGDFDTISFKTYEIWPSHQRHNCFIELMTGYYESIYLGHKTADAAKTPAPKNFWPYSYQFYKCNPVLTFSAIVENSNSNPEIKIETYVQPDDDRSTLAPIPMPSQLLSIEELIFAINSASDSDLKNCISKRYDVSELRLLASNLQVKRRDLNKLYEMLPIIDEVLRDSISLRDTDKPKTNLTAYTRK